MAAGLWLAADPHGLAAALAQPPAVLLRETIAAAWGLLLATLLAFGAVAGIDLLWTRWRFLRRLRMSREELREEIRDTEGEPQIKGRRRRLAEGRARRRMMAAMPQAAVVITNPTHYAVALAYRQGDEAAPRVVAKGVEVMAARIRAAAAAHGVPIVSDAPLARALHRLELDTEIPPEHWQAVAAILAYVWGLGGRAAAAAHAPGTVRVGADG